MADLRNRRNTKKQGNNDDRVIYLDKNDIKQRRRQRSTQTTGNDRIAAKRAVRERGRLAETHTAEAQSRRRPDTATDRQRTRRADRSQTVAGRTERPRTPVGRTERPQAGRTRTSTRSALQGTTPQRRRTEDRQRSRGVAERRPTQGKRPSQSRRPADRQRGRRPASSSLLSQLRLPKISLSYNNDAAGAKRTYRKTSRRANNTGMLIIVIFLFVIFTLYVAGSFVKSRHSKNIDYETIKLGSVDSAKKADGVIIRSEKVFTAPSSGAVKYSVPESEKIRSGTVVCSISNAQEVAKIQENVDSLNNDIMKMQQSRVDISEHTEEVKKLESQIKDITDVNTFAFASGDFTNVYDLKYSVDNKITTRNQLLLTENTGSLTDLVGQRNTEIDRINSNTKQITSDVGGILCYNIDGSEAIFTAENIPKLTEDQVKKSIQGSEIKANVAANDPVFKVITSNEWYIASYIPDEYTEGWEAGSEMPLYLQNGVEANREIDVTLVSVDHDRGNDGKKAYAVFKTAEYMSDYMDMRNISFEIDKPKIGYKIPDTSVTQQTLLKIPSDFVDKDNNTVIKVTADGDKVTSITPAGNIEEDKESYTLVPVQMGYLSPGDKIKHGDKTFETGEVVSVDGVFLVNSGVTRFIKINKNDSISGGGYTVLDQASNPDLHIYDRVVQNVTNVQENQNIYE